MGRIIYSFIVDRGATFSYQAWHLAHSLVKCCDAEPGDIHVQFTPGSDASVLELFQRHGFSTHTLIPFGDKKYCNKIVQFENLPLSSADTIVLLDTDTIAVGDLRQWISDRAICGKIVDLANPPIECLRELADLACIDPGEACLTDAGDGETFPGNCNGGMYAIPAQLASRLSVEWLRWAYWLLDNPGPLQRHNCQTHVDQVSFWMALRSAELPFEEAPTNANYFTHLATARRYCQPSKPIALLHYHDRLNAVGKIEGVAGLDAAAEQAIARANEQIGTHFDNRLFWEFRYERHPELGSGIGSRDENLSYKRALLKHQGIEAAASVLDVGCGDLEIVKALTLRAYTGLDASPLAVAKGVQLFPQARFVLGLKPDTPPADFVVCLEVLIHQQRAADYFDIIAFAAERTSRTLIVSGYDANTDAIRHNSMVFFHEPLVQSLRNTGRFSSISEVGRHTDVVIYRCDV